MMRRLSATELDGLRDYADETMQDWCYILRRSRATNDYGEEVDTYTADAKRTRCGFKPTGRRQVIGGQVTYTDVDAKLRLPIGTSIDTSCRVRIDERHGQDVTDEDFEVATEPMRGPSAITVELTRISR